MKFEIIISLVRRLQKTISSETLIKSEHLIKLFATTCTLFTEELRKISHTFCVTPLTLFFLMSVEIIVNFEILDQNI